MAPMVSLSHLISLPLILISTFFFPLVFSSSFSFPSFSPNDPNILFSDGAAVSSDGSLRLTDGQALIPGRNASSVGSSSRAYHKQSIQLWRRDTNTTTNFDTYFEFSISFPNVSSNSSTSLTGSFIFFLAPESLSTTNPISSSADGRKQAVSVLAVEFDSFRQQNSSSNSTGGAASAAGDTLAAHVSYNSSSRVLLVNVHKPRQAPAAANGTNSSSFLSISYVVNLQQVLPEKVLVGFSAVTNGSEAAVVQRITTWNFTSDVLPGPEGPFKTWYLGPIIGLPLSVLLIFACYYFGGEDVKVTMLTVLLSPFICCIYLSSICKGETEAKLGGEPAMDDELAMGTNPRRFTYKALASATGNFTEKRKLGQGGFGVVYKGVLQPSGKEVAVKKISSSSKQGRKEYESEVKIISRLRHRNLVRLIGWCQDRSDFLLVYEYLPNGSLDYHLFSKNSSLPWKLRYGVVVGLSSALLYLHEEWEQCVVHRDIKSSNVMLDSEFNAKLGDFGLARLVDHKLGQQTTLPAGTLGYLAPECVLNGKASKESDVYSFGVVALEIATGRKAVVHGSDRELRVVEQVWELNGAGRLMEAADPGLGGDFDVKQMEALLLSGLWCAHPDQGQRPTMRQVIQVLTSEGKIPDIPKTMPVPIFAQPPVEVFNSNPSSVTYASIVTGR